LVVDAAVAVALVVVATVWRVVAPADEAGEVVVFPVVDPLVVAKVIVEFPEVVVMRMAVDVVVEPAEVELAVALKALQAAWPALCAWMSSPTPVHAATRQPTTLLAMAACVGPHWQPASSSPQPAAVIADARQDVAHAGCPEKFWARTPPNAAEKKKASFILE